MQADAMPLAEREKRTLQPGPAVPGHAIQQDEEYFTFVIDQSLVVCRPTEFYCLRTLLEQANQCVPLAQLAAYLPEIGDQEKAAELKSKRRRMRRLMMRLRKYLTPLGIEIVNVRLMGYLLVLPTPDEPTNR